MYRFIILVKYGKSLMLQGGLLFELYMKQLDQKLNSKVIRIIVSILEFGTSKQKRKPVSRDQLNLQLSEESSNLEFVDSRFSLGKDDLLGGSGSVDIVKVMKLILEMNSLGLLRLDDLATRGRNLHAWSSRHSSNSRLHGCGCSSSSLNNSIIYLVILNLPGRGGTKTKRPIGFIIVIHIII